MLGSLAVTVVNDWHQPRTFAHKTEVDWSAVQLRYEKKISLMQQ
jgi:hypothetical protein